VETLVPTAKPNRQTLSPAELRSDLDTVLARVAQNDSFVVVERDGRPVAAIVQAQELERLRRLDDEWRRPFAVIDQMRAAFADLSEEDIERDVADVIARTRAEARRAAETNDPK
jgi:PHD/YefM family antitoxin component YafN of YafNO toxin-antitoxin module